MNVFIALSVACEIELEEIHRANVGHITRIDGKITKSVAKALGERGGQVYHRTALNIHGQPMAAVVAGPAMCSEIGPEFYLPIRYGNQIVHIDWDTAPQWSTNRPEVTS